jgi:hypothetical protein
MMAYAPPAPILIFVVIDDILNAVHVVIRKATIIISHAPSKPAFPTTQPSLRYMITPSIVRRVGVKTPPKVLNFLGAAMSILKLNN